MDDHRPIEDKVLEFLSTLHDNHEVGDQRWIRTLLDHGVNNTTSEIVELGAMIQTTVMDMLLEKLLGINPMVLAKATLVEDYIGEIWKHNSLEKQSLYNFILDNPEQREAILQLIQSKTNIESNLPLPIEQLAEGANDRVTQIKDMTQEQFNQHNQQSNSTILTTGTIATAVNHTLSTNLEEPAVQEITMTEAEVDRIPETVISVMSHDIKDVSDYSIRNRIFQPTNPFFITKKGSNMAGVLMANTPEEDQEKQTNYLAHLFRLAKDEKYLIQNAFINGNYWFTVQFKLALDMTNWVKRINSREGEDFRILYLKGEFKQEPKQIKTEESPTQHNRKQHDKELNIKVKDGEQPQTTKAKGKSMPGQEKNGEMDKEDIRKANRPARSNPYNLISGKSPIGIGMMIGTFPGANRQEQLAVLAEIYGIPTDSELINIEHRNGNSWFTGYFKKEEERAHCIQKVEEINKEVKDMDTEAEVD